MPLLRLAPALFALAATATVVQSRQPDPQGTAAASPVANHAVGFYDPRLQRVVLVGGPGDPGPGDRDSVWSWSGTRWERVTEEGPSARVNASAAYDVRRGRAVVTGGARKVDGTKWEVMGDSWEADEHGWRRLADVAPRDHHSLVEWQRGILMFGGIPGDRSAPWPADTWTLDDRGWTRVAIEGPTGRARSAMAYDGKRRRVVLFGGVSAPSGPQQSQVFLGDTWTWDGRRWSKVADDGPRGRYAHGMVFDQRAGVVLLYSGAAAHRDSPLSDMWQWDGKRWREIHLDGPTPGYRYQPVMVYDRARDRTVLYGGSGGPRDTWEWDGRRWRRVTP